jgi:hypothetical protein
MATKYRVVCLFLVLFGFAASTSAAWVTGMTIRNVRSSGSLGEVTFSTVEPMVNPAACGATDFYGIMAADNVKQALAILLAAQVSNSKINFYVLDTPGTCEGNGRPRVTDVMIGNY